MSSSKLALSFRIFQHGQLVREETLTLGVIKIGKVPSAHLRLDDDAVSRMHAIVEVTGDEVSLIDLGSTRGTFVNGKRINKAMLQSGDSIVLGDTRIEFGVGDAVAYRVAAAAAQAAQNAAAAARPPALPAAARLRIVEARASQGEQGGSEAAPADAGGGLAAPAASPFMAAARSVPVDAGEGLAPAASPFMAAARSVPVNAGEGLAPAASPFMAAARSVPVNAGEGLAPAASPFMAAARTSEAAPVDAGARVAAPANPFMAAVRGAPLAAVTTVPTVVVAPELGDAGRRAVAPKAASAAAVASPLFAREAAEAQGGARAVEVAAMFGDTVVNVKHCIDPRGGKVTLATWAFLAGGAACLLASAIAFATSVSAAAANKHALDQWTRIDHKPAYAFRPRAVGASVDWAAFGGLALGLVGLTLGVTRARRERIDPYYRIGTAPGVQLALEHAPSPAFALVAPSGDDFVFNYGAGIDGELLVDGTATPFAELARAGRTRPSASTAGAIEVAIPANGRIRARAGQTTFLVSAVARPRRHVSPLLAGLDRRVVSYVAGSLALHVGIWALLQAAPPDATGINADLPTSENPLVRVQGTTREDPPPELQPVEDGSDVGDQEAALPMPLPSGASGSPEATQEAKLKVARVADVDPQRSKEEAIRQATIAGALGSSLLMTSVKALAATGDIASGFDTESMNGGIYGGDGLGRGNFGNGLRGWNVGGGCLVEPCGTIPSGGRYDKLLAGTRKGTHYGVPGTRNFGMPGHKSTLPRVSDPVIAGSDYSKSIIRRYILRYRDQLSYCYEKQLLANPSLAGQVSASFFIGTSGRVQSSSATGVAPEVSSCIASVIGTIAFPAPRDGGVQVNYPFTFRPTTG